jgi:protein-S-isoprenylcysteine O-methyltransferase Ste14
VPLIVRFRRTYTYDFVTRLLGGMWFLLLALVVAKGVIDGFGRQPWPLLASRGCMAMFCATLCLLILRRPPAKSQAHGLLPRALAFAGTYMPWAIAFAGHTDNLVVNLASAACLGGGNLLALITVSYLGRSFSVVPQARSVVQAGPYRWIRHPLYLSEEIAVLGVVLQAWSPLAAAMLVAHIGLQIGRILYEEDLLRRTLPDYRKYAASRWRLVPFIW